MKGGKGEKKGERLRIYEKEGERNHTTMRATRAPNVAKPPWL